MSYKEEPDSGFWASVLSKERLEDALRYHRTGKMPRQSDRIIDTGASVKPAGSILEYASDGSKEILSTAGAKAAPVTEMV